MIGIDPEARAIMARLNKTLGPGTAMMGSDTRTYGRFPTGSIGLDRILGGGWSANQWHEIYGETSAGKTNLAFATVAVNQRRDPCFTTVFIAAEEFVKDWAEDCGVDTNRLIIVETSIMEDAYNAVIEFAGSRSVDCVIVDSLPALVPAEEDEKDMNGNTMAGGSKITGHFFRKVGKATKRSMLDQERPFLGLMLNQYRMKIGVMYGDARTTPGGTGKDFAYFSRVELRRDDWIEVGVGKDKDRIGQTIKATTKKNKSAPPFQVATYDLYFDHGGPVPKGQIDYVKEIVTLAILFEIIVRKGAWYLYDGQQWQGRDALTEAVHGDDNMQKLLEQAVLQVGRVAT